MRNTKKPIQLYRGTTQQHSDYAGPVGEITVDTEKYTVVVQNGVTGGVPLAREDTVVSLTNRIAAEESVRATADTALRISITDEVSARKSADTAFQNSIASEASARETVDTALQNSVASEASARTTADTALQNSVASEASARTTADMAIQKSVTDEVSARKAADTALSNRLDVVEPVLVASDFTGDTNTVKKYVDAAMKNRASLASPAFSGTPTAPTADKGTNSTQIATTAFVQAAISEASGAVIGEVRWFAMSTPPEGWLICNGASVSTSDYAALFAVIGKTFTPRLTRTAPDPDIENPEYRDPTVFRLPNLMGKVPWGSSTQIGTEMKAGLPNISGSFTVVGDGEGSGWVSNTHGQGAFYDNVVNSTTQFFAHCIDNDGRTCYQSFDASRSNSIYGASTTVQPPALCLLPCIRYE